MVKKVLFATLTVTLIILLLMFTIIRIPDKANKEEFSGIRMSFVGDLMMARTVTSKMNWFGVKVPFKYTQEHLSNSDIAFANFEGLISNKEGIRWKSCCEFKTSTKVIEGLKLAGFDVISVANNHMMDFGDEVYQDTISNIQSAGIKTIGTNYNFGYSNSQDFTVFEVKGKKIGFLGYYDNEYNKWYIHDDTWLPQPLIYEEEHFLEDIKSARGKVDILVVSIHWGDEYKNSHNERQEYIAHLAVDNGADIIIGHHTHMVQEIEEYNGGLIAYGLGNFVSDQPTDLTPGTYENKQKTRDSMILDVFIDGVDNSITYKINKLKIFNRCQPRFLDE